MIIISICSNCYIITLAILKSDDHKTNNIIYIYIYIYIFITMLFVKNKNKCIPKINMNITLTNVYCAGDIITYIT